MIALFIFIATAAFDPYYLETPEPPFPLDNPYPLQVDPEVKRQLIEKESEKLMQKMEAKKLPILPFVVGLLFLGLTSLLLFRKRKIIVKKQELKIPKDLEKKDLYLALEKLTRKILQERYHIPALYQSTRELKEEIQKKSLKREISLFLEEANLVKFAKKPLKKQEVERAKKLVQDLLKPQAKIPN